MEGVERRSQWCARASLHSEQSFSTTGGSSLALSIHRDITVFSKAAGKRKVDDQAAATESRTETDYMMGQWREGMRETTGMLGDVMSDTFREALSGGGGEGVSRREFEHFADEQRALHRQLREEQEAG
jgi:hypothetical protein